MTTKPLIALGVVAAFGLPMSQAAAQAAPAPCTTEYRVSQVEAPGFTCSSTGTGTTGHIVLSNFTFSSSVPAQSLVEIGVFGREFTVTFNRDGTSYGVDPTFGYTLTSTNGVGFNTATMGVDVSTLVPTVTSMTNVMGNNSGANTLNVINGGTKQMTLSPPDITDHVMITSTQPAGTQMNSISNDFTKNGPSVPEPATFGLLALGLLGAGVAGRRRRN